MPATSSIGLPPHCTTVEVAGLLGLAVRSVQLMVDRGELEAWKTTGGHRRILRESVERWMAQRRSHRPQAAGSSALADRPDREPVPSGRSGHAEVLIIEDSVHYQKLLSMLMAQRFPEVQVHLAADGISGLAICGSLRPDLLIVDILLPGIDGAALVSTLRSHEHFSAMQLIVVTALDETQREPYALALDGVPVVHKTQIVQQLPALIDRCLAPRRPVAA